MQISSFRDLVVWQKGMELVEAVYQIASRLPSDEKYGLRAQMQRAAVSVPSNIAEGFGRMHRKAYANHVSIARGSVMEIQTQLELCVRLGVAQSSDVKDAWNLADEVARMLTTLNKKLRQPKAP